MIKESQQLNFGSSIDVWVVQKSLHPSTPLHHLKVQGSLRSLLLWNVQESTKRHPSIGTPRRPSMRDPPPAWHATHQEAFPGTPLSLLCCRTRLRRPGRGRFSEARGTLHPGTQSLFRMTKSCRPCPGSHVFFLLSGR